MKPICAIILMAMTLGACAPKPTILTVPEPVVFIPDDRLFVCPTIRNFPDPTTLTDGEIADLLIRLDTNNRTCRRSINAIRDQLLEAQAQLENDDQ